ncbi:MAG: AAA family ATPase, partial [Pseudomonadota bacterium]|nr:AAA family ATPase [Pseudomonadota bacterium]
MELKKIKLHGFKSFEKQTELEIKKGLTGIVGPNGCGKSNVLDSLQWVMGETSYKNLRGSEMDDVIFSGTDTSPSRNFAEVSVIMSETSNTSDKNKSSGDEYEIKRRIERNSGSKYYINSIEKRAKDVQLFFADNSLGPHSISIVKQGQINQIIESKPNERRKILEEAAGISGLHHRKHEAILKLNATRQNIERLTDIISVVGTEMSSLKRQANQAEKFKAIASQIRDYEKELLKIDWHSIEAKREELDQNIKDIQDNVKNIKNEIGSVEFENNDLGDFMKPIREEYENLIDDLQQKRSNELNLKNELQYTTEKIITASKQVDQILIDLDREKTNLADQESQLKDLDSKLAELHKTINDIEKIESNIIQASSDATDSYKMLEKEYNSYLSEVLTMETENKNIEDQIEECHENLKKLSTELENALKDKSYRGIDDSSEKDRDLFINKQKKIEESLISTLRDIDQCEENKRKLSQDLEKNKELSLILNFEIRQSQKTKIELEEYLLSIENPDAVVNKIKITDGFEKKVGRILNDLEISTLKNGKKFWINTNQEFDDEFADCITPLADLIEGPEEIHLFLKYTGYTEVNEINKIKELLRPGQQVINANGEMIRWDGFVQKFSNDAENINIPHARKKIIDLSKNIQSNEMKLETLKKDAREVSKNLEKIINQQSTEKENWKRLIEEQKLVTDKIKELDKKIITEKDLALSNEIKINSIEENIKINNRNIESLSSKKINKSEIEKAQNTLEKAKQDFYNAKTIADIKEANTQNILKEKRDLEKNQKDLIGSRNSWEVRKNQTENHLKDLNQRLNNSEGLLKSIESEPEKIKQKQSEIEIELERSTRKKKDLQEKLDT